MSTILFSSFVVFVLLTRMSAPVAAPVSVAPCQPVRVDRRRKDNIYCVLLTRKVDESPAFMFVQWSEGMALPAKEPKGGARRGGKKAPAPVPVSRGAYVHGIMKGRVSGFDIQRYQLLPKGGVHAQAVALGLLPLFAPFIGPWEALNTSPTDAFPWQVCADVATLSHDHCERVERAADSYKAWYGDAPGLRRKYYIGDKSYFYTIRLMYFAARDATRAYVQSVVAHASAEGVADALAKMRAWAAEGCMPMETMENDSGRYTAVQVPIVVPGL